MSERDIKVQAIINPISGVGSKRKIPKMIEGICSKKNCSLNISFTEYAGHASELTRQAIEEGAEYILAVGGDGTLNEIARAMIHSNAILGIIPKGSGNGLARELHIPMDVKRAIDLIAKGHVTTIDCCRANGQVFFCTCGVGFDAAVSQKFANEKRRGSLTYIKNTIDEYLSYKPEPYELVVDNQTIKEKAFLVACAMLRNMVITRLSLRTRIYRTDGWTLRSYPLLCHWISLLWPFNCLPNRLIGIVRLRR